jgi:acetyl esterase/lipase
VPTDAAKPPPVLLLIHGGGWSKGKKEDLAFYNIVFAELGYATASVQYRLSPGHRFPAAIQDVKCAMVWLKNNGEAMGFDASRMVLMGGSAGGHLALLAGYSQDSALECSGTPGAVDTRVAGIVNLYGVVDCTTPVAQEARQVLDFIGKPYPEAEAVYAQASPMHHLDKSDPPTLTFHGTIDELVPVSQADDLHVRLDELGIPNYYDRVEGWPHSMDLAQPINDRCRFIIERFLEKHLPLTP